MELVAEVRKEGGANLRSLREGGLIPAEFYGRGIENKHITVPLKEFGKVFKDAGMSTVVTLCVEREKYPVVIHDIQKDFLTSDIMHVDFYKVRMDEKLKVKVPLEFTGESLAVKSLGGVLNKSMSEIEIEALPGDLPHQLTVSLNTLDVLEKSVYVRDIEIPRGVTIVTDTDAAVVTVTAPRAEEVVEAAPVDVSAIKVETEEKKEERAAKKSETEKE